MSVHAARLADAVQIARCPEHGLHGARERCFDCGGVVDQIEYVPAERVVAALEKIREASGQIEGIGLTVDQALVVTGALLDVATALNP